MIPLVMINMIMQFKTHNIHKSGILTSTPKEIH